MNKKKVTITLLSYNGERYLPWLLQSIKAQTFSDWELLVLDNASVDKSVALVKEYCPQARIITQKSNLGFARGHNLLLNWSDSEYVLVLNQDVILDEDYLARLVDFMDKNKKAGSVAGKLLYWDFEAGKKSQQIDSFGIKIDRRRQASDLHQGEEDFALENREVFAVSAAAALYRRQSLEMAAYSFADSHREYFDEDFFAYKEDVDLGWRLRLLGWQSWLVAAARAYHHRSLSRRQGWRQRRSHKKMAHRLSYRNHWLMLYKNSFARHIFKDLFYIKFYELQKFVYLLLFERSSLAAIGDYLRLLPKAARKKTFVMKNRRVDPADIYPWFQ
ncbi:MAG: glycosyltransferase family 2 protein [Patescibacteria group bacterium]|nr:glycosyltransferase family 2 protein [Patescibacteria group bacterium]